MTSPLYGFSELTGTTVERTSVNLNFRYIESLFGSAPTGINVFTPPTAPMDGSVYLIDSGGLGNPTPPTGIWADKSGQVGVYTSSGWFYTTKHPDYTFGSGTWTQTNGGGGGGTATTDASLLTTGTLNDARLSTNVPLVAKVNTFTKAQGVEPVALIDGASIAVDLSLSNNLTVTTAGNRAFANPTNMVAGHSFNLFVTQDSVGNRVPTWESAYKFGSPGVPTPSTNANAMDWYRFYCDGTNMIFENIVLGGSPPFVGTMLDTFNRSGALIGSSVETGGFTYASYFTGGGSGVIVSGAAESVPALGVGTKLAGLVLPSTYTINARINPQRYLSIITRASSSATQTEGVWVSFVSASNLVRIESVNSSFVDTLLISTPAVFPGTFFDCQINVTPTSVQVLIPSLSINLTASTTTYAANDTVGFYFDATVAIPEKIDSWEIL